MIKADKWRIFSKSQTRRGRLACLLFVSLTLMIAVVGWHTAATPASLLTVQNTVAGTTPDILGYNLAHFMEGSNARDWFRYSGVKAARAFISPSDIEPTDDIPGTGDGVTSSVTFFSRKAALRANTANPAVALDTSFINWPAFYDNYENNIGSNNRFKINYTFAQLRAQGVDILANITASPNRFPIADANDWPNKWELWQHYYASATERRKIRQAARRPNCKPAPTEQSTDAA